MGVVTNGYVDAIAEHWPVRDRGREVVSIYVHPNERYVVSLVVGYADDPDPDVGVVDAWTAAMAALDLTNDGGRGGTVWHVFDRQTGLTHRFEQEELEDADEPA